MHKVLSIVFFLLSISASASADHFDPAVIVNDEGGVVAITGEMHYTNPFFTVGVASPLIILEDQAGFVDRDTSFLFPPESQTLGQLTSDFYTSPVSYSLALPIEPQASLRDVDNDGEQDTGVMIFAVAYWANIWGDPFLEQRDQQGGGWSTAYASTRVSSNPETLREIVGGKYVIYAPDDHQGFPSGFGDDGLLFTEDDPIVSIPQGWTVVNLNTSPFEFDRSRNQVIELIEPTEAALIDFSDLSYTEAFDAMIEKFRKEYAFTEHKNIEWDDIQAKYRSYFEEAEETNNTQLYLDTLSELIWSIPDGHVNLAPLTPFAQRWRNSTINSIGIAIRETDNNRVFVTYVVANSPAALAGITVGTELTALNGQPISDYINRIRPLTVTASTEYNYWIAQQQYATRFPVDRTEVEIAYRDASGESVTRTLNTIQEYESFLAFEDDETPTGFELPVEYELLPGGIVIVRINSFFDDRLLMIQLWERMIQTMKNEGAQGLIIDIRRNGGGNGFIADQMTGYFFDEDFVVGQRGRYSPDIDAFFFDPEADQIVYAPAEELQYDGPVVVLVGHNCASACERFAYNMTVDNRSQIVGFYPTAGLGGGVEDFRMPEGITIRFTVTRSVNSDGEIHIEGTGIEPTVRVPFTEETLFSESDPILETAIELINAQR